MLAGEVPVLAANDFVHGPFILSPPVTIAVLRSTRCTPMLLDIDA